MNLIPKLDRIAELLQRLIKLLEQQSNGAQAPNWEPKAEPKAGRPKKG